MSEDRKIDPAISELRKLREEQKIKQYELAKTLDMKSASTLASYENGIVSPQLATLRDWAYSLDRDLQLVPVEKKNRARAVSVSEDLITVQLTQYQTALAMGILISDAHTISSDKLSRDVQDIADLLVIALGS